VPRKPCSSNGRLSPIALSCSTVDLQQTDNEWRERTVHPVGVPGEPFARAVA
jgi:hypothetical protein